MSQIRKFFLHKSSILYTSTLTCPLLVKKAEIYSQVAFPEKALKSGLVVAEPMFFLPKEGSRLVSVESSMRYLVG